MKLFRLLLVASLACLFTTHPAELVAKPASAKDGKQLTYRAISGWQRGKTTSEDIKMSLGLPTIINATAQGTEWYYKTDKVSLRIQFNEDRTLSAYQYQEVGSGSSYKEATQQVKALVVGTTETDLIRRLGEPSYVSVSTAGKQLYYRNLLTHSTLQVLVNERVGLLTNYLLLGEGSQKATLDVTKLTDITQGQTVASEVVAWFGEPTKRVLEKDKETWYYQSNSARLTFTFAQDEKKTVSTYQYQQR